MHRIIGGDTIYGLKTVNRGEIIEFDSADPVNPMRNLIVERLNPEKHNPNYQILCYYIWDTNNCTKIELTIYRDLECGRLGSEIYYFKTKNDLQHYRSSNHPDFRKLPQKYKQYVNYLMPYFNQIFY